MRAVCRYCIVLLLAVAAGSCSDFNPLDSYRRVPPDRSGPDTEDEGDGAGGLFEKGYGTSDKPYLIMDAAQIRNMAQVLVKRKTVCFRLGADIDMASVPDWEPLNPQGDYFIDFDGGYHVIRNFACLNKGYASFFGILAGVCRNVGFYNARVEAAEGSGAGIIGGYIGKKAPDAAEQAAQVENCYVSGTVRGKYAGGIAARMGRPYDGRVCSIRNCYSTAEVTAGADECGGIVGTMFERSEVSNCYATGVLYSESKTGGIAAVACEGALLTDCIAWNWKIQSTSGQAGRICAWLYPGEKDHEATPSASGCSAWKGIVCAGFAPADQEGPATAGGYQGIGEDLPALRNRVAGWGTSWHADGGIDLGFPVLQWQQERGDYDRYAGHDNEPEGDFAGGDGSREQPYLIASAAHIRNVPKALIAQTKVYFALVADIDMQGIDWVSLNGSDGYHKWIDFDGRNHVIRNFSCRTGAYPSFFGVLCGDCRNVGFVDADVSSENTGIGIVAGYVGLASGTDGNYTGRIENCYVTGKLTGSGAAGGIGGVLGGSYGGQESSIKNCYSAAAVYDRLDNDTGKAGGLIGRKRGTGGTIENCYVSGTVRLHNGGSIGGLIGEFENGSTLTVRNCVVWSDRLTGKRADRMGRIVGGGAGSGTYENCWAFDGMALQAGEETVAVSDESTPSKGTFQGVAAPAGELGTRIKSWNPSLWIDGEAGYPVFFWAR